MATHLARAPASKADDYLAFLEECAVPDYAGLEGCLGAYILRRVEGEVAHFQTLTFWLSEATIRAFAGENVLETKYYLQDEDFLLELEAKVRHFDVTEGQALRPA